MQEDEGIYDKHVKKKLYNTWGRGGDSNSRAFKMAENHIAPYYTPSVYTQSTTQAYEAKG